MDNKNTVHVSALMYHKEASFTSLEKLQQEEMALLAENINSNSKYNKIKWEMCFVICNYQQNVWLALGSSAVRLLSVGHGLIGITGWYYYIRFPISS